MEKKLNKLQTTILTSHSHSPLPPSLKRVDKTMKNTIDKNEDLACLIMSSVIFSHAIPIGITGE